MLNIIFALFLWFILCFFVIGFIVVLVQKHRNNKIVNDDKEDKKSED